MLGMAYFATVFGVLGAILYVGMGGGGSPMEIPANGIGFILVMALQ